MRHEALLHVTGTGTLLSHYKLSPPQLSGNKKLQKEGVKPWAASRKQEANETRAYLIWISIQAIGSSLTVNARACTENLAKSSQGHQVSHMISPPPLQRRNWTYPWESQLVILLFVQSHIRLVWWDIVMLHSHLLCCPDDVWSAFRKMKRNRTGLTIHHRRQISWSTIWSIPTWLQHPHTLLATKSSNASVKSPLILKHVRETYINQFSGSPRCVNSEIVAWSWRIGRDAQGFDQNGICRWACRVMR